MSAAVDHAGFAKAYAAEAAARIAHSRNKVAHVVTIDKGIPMPKSSSNSLGIYSGKPQKYPFRDMEVGDSLLFTKFDQPHVSSMAKGSAGHLGYVFSTRKVSDGVRVWRVS